MVYEELTDILADLPPLICDRCERYTHRGGPEYREADGQPVSPDYVLCSCTLNQTLDDAIRAARVITRRGVCIGITNPATPATPRRPN